jgi:simple sugar transport system ATP-binding protein
MKVELRNIHKTFGKVHANDGITLTIPAGTIQGILGENGAGKSTLMKILSGFIQADSGEILLDEKPVKISAPADAIHHGIGMLHQDPLDFPPMTVLDNFLIGREGQGIIPNRREAKAALERLMDEYDFHLDPEAFVDSLSVGERQQLEILRLLWLGAGVLILDEPTTGISALQKGKLFETLRKLAEQGKTAIFVSHKLEDVEGLCGRVAVMSRGKLVGQAVPPYSTQDLVKMMFGKQVSLGDRVDTVCDQTALRLSNVSVEDYRLDLRKVSLEVKCGEVIGLAGMEGSGQRQFLQTCAGLIRPVEGSVAINDKEMTGKSYHRFMECGVAYVPAARLEEGLIPGLTITEHFTLLHENGGLFIKTERMRSLANDRIAEYNIRGTPASRVEALSGGNQQRALLALMRAPLSLILMEHPTRGLDMESAIYIWSLLKERCKQGTSIIFMSSDLEEVLQYSDRILVFFGGKVSQPIPSATTNVDQLGVLIGGKGW